MREIFDKVKAKCATCGTKLNGEDITKIGRKYYCRSDGEKESAREKALDKKKIDEINNYKKLF